MKVLIDSPLHQSFKEALTQAQQQGHSRLWRELLKNPQNSAADAFLALLDFGGSPGFFSSVGSFKSLDEWLAKAEKWRQLRLDPRKESNVGDDILFQLWNHFRDGLAELLRRGRLTGKIPMTGGVLFFCGGLARCLVINYDFIGETPRFEIVTIIRNPQSVFDFIGALDHVDASVQNVLKGILATGHKVIVHRGILTHIDRREEADVFGPSIDTLVLSEVLAQEIFERDHTMETAIDIGSGSGMLTAALFQHLRGLRELFAIDTNQHAIDATARNLQTTRRMADTRSLPLLYLIRGRFDPDLISRRFDLIVCNPPYIPMPPRLKTEGVGVPNEVQAVGGTELMRTLLSSAHSLLKPGGRMLLMASSVSIDESLSWIPDRLSVRRPFGDGGLQVIFDVEAVFGRKDWLSFLNERGGLVMNQGTYYHSLHPLWVEVP